MWVDQVVLWMGTDETNVNLAVLVVDSYYQSKLIIFNVENYPSVSNQSGFRILCFQIMWRIPDFPFYFIVPSL